MIPSLSGSAPIQEIGFPKLLAVAIASPGIGHENGVPQAGQDLERVAFGLDGIRRADLRRELGRETARGTAMDIREQGIRLSRGRARRKEKQPLYFEAVGAFPMDDFLGSQADVLELGVREREPDGAELVRTRDEYFGGG
jgi:hypothetical protein